MSLVQPLVDFVRRLLSQPRARLSAAQRTLRYAIELGWHCAEELRHDRASQMAAALTYRTIFSLIPTVILSLVLFRALGGFERYEQDFRQQVYQFLGLKPLVLPPAPPPSINFQDVDTLLDAFAAEAPGVALSPQAEGFSPGSPAPPNGSTPPAPGSTTASPPPPDATPSLRPETTADAQLRASVDRTLDDIIVRVSNLSFASIGGVGAALLIWTALSLVITVEESFNRIYNCPLGRPLYMRIMIYWAVMTLGPLLLVISLYVTGRIIDVASSIDVLGPVVWFFSRGTGFMASWLLLFLIYLLMPNTIVRRRPALIGSLVAAFLWELAKVGFRAYVNIAVPYSAFYGTLGLIPLFLYWVYLTWLIVLFGLELTFTLQAMGSGQFKHEAARAGGEMVYDPRAIISVAAAVGVAFRAGKAATSHELATRLSLPHRAVARFLDVLETAGVINRVARRATGDVAFALACPPQSVPLARLLDLAAAMGVSPDPDADDQGAAAYVAKLSRAERLALGDATLATALSEAEAARPVPPPGPRPSPPG